ncbi:MAG: CHASE4 domain-containing protein [Candidatus Competibacter sp.]|nr:CHASE4 domain-containing protein [Candidatus Competibacter sp.]
MNPQSGNIQLRIIGLLFLIIALFVAGLTVMKNAELERLALLERNAADERATLFDKLLALKGQTLKNYAFDYSVWDEMVAFVRSKDLEWARINLDETLASQKLAVAWIYGADFEPLYVTRKPVPGLSPAGPAPPAAIRDWLRDQPFQHFFIDTATDLLEIRAAPIQPSADTQRQTPAQGYLLVGQFWDAEYLESLSELIGGTVTLQPATATAEQMIDRASAASRSCHRLDTRLVVGHSCRRFSPMPPQRRSPRSIGTPDWGSSASASPALPRWATDSCSAQDRQQRSTGADPSRPSRDTTRFHMKHDAG